MEPSGAFWSRGGATHSLGSSGESQAVGCASPGKPLQAPQGGRWPGSAKAQVTGRGCHGRGLLVLHSNPARPLSGLGGGAAFLSWACWGGGPGAAGAPASSAFAFFPVPPASPP